ncbi:hypothetical protein H6P81_007247 [Aristolochia fimbriata]|uniref:Reverse transcriptase Ty1/copia-type domain-containing protein n=1 Tax=Aristolochia fimbriata TaxID=158543 RepID=A0AAV7EZV3_ARIFI|nr:hypothetical protein H6P81_007247 [Aristolochia fimbriata]
MVGVLETKKYLTIMFKMKDLGEVDTILGIKVRKQNGCYVLNQSHYIKKIIDKYSYLEFKDYNTPHDTSMKLSMNFGRAIAQLEYASVIGSLMYDMHCTRPDVAYVVCKLSRYTSNPGAIHWKAIGRILGYLKSTIAYEYNEYPNVLEGYCDASWMSSCDYHMSTSG